MWQKRPPTLKMVLSPPCSARISSSSRTARSVQYSCKRAIRHFCSQSLQPHASPKPQNGSIFFRWSVISVRYLKPKFCVNCQSIGSTYFGAAPMNCRRLRGGLTPNECKFCRHAGIEAARIERPLKRMLTVRPGALRDLRHVDDPHRGISRGPDRSFRRSPSIQSEAA